MGFLNFVEIKLLSCHELLCYFFTLNRLIAGPRSNWNNWIGPIVKHGWNIALHVLHYVLAVFHSHNSVPLGAIQAFTSVYRIGSIVF